MDRIVTVNTYKIIRGLSLKLKRNWGAYPPCRHPQTTPTWRLRNKEYPYRKIKWNTEAKGLDGTRYLKIPHSLSQCFQNGAQAGINLRDVTLKCIMGERCEGCEGGPFKTHF
jgi:hypothetical protein